jgi:alkylhydroperoxidase family enzyme
VAAKGEEAPYRAALEDWRTAPVEPRVRATLGFLEKLTLRPADVTPADVEELRAAGVNDRGIEEAIAVATVFNVIDRLADAFDFDIPSAEQLKFAPKFLLNLGYRTISLPG